MADRELNHFTRPSLIRLARIAGVKSMSDDCYGLLRQIIDNRLQKIVKTAYLINEEHQTKTIMPDDIYSALSIHGYNLTESSDLSVKKK